MAWTPKNETKSFLALSLLRTFTKKFSCSRTSSRVASVKLRQGMPLLKHSLDSSESSLTQNATITLSRSEPPLRKRCKAFFQPSGTFLSNTRKDAHSSHSSKYVTSTELKVQPQAQTYWLHPEPNLVSFHRLIFRHLMSQLTQDPIELLLLNGLCPQPSQPRRPQKAEHACDLKTLKGNLLDCSHPEGA